MNLDGRPSGLMTVVGIAADVRRGGSDRRSVAEIYLPPSDDGMRSELARLGPVVALDLTARDRLAPFRRTAWLLALSALVMSVVTVISCFAASRGSLVRTALCGAVLGISIVALGSSVLARLAMPSPSAVGVGCAAAGALLLTLPAMLSRRYSRPVPGPPTA